MSVRYDRACFPWEVAPIFRPRDSELPLVRLATVAAVIASQALISGAYSLTMQAIQMRYLPRLQIRPTSHVQRGQIYVPQVNSFLMVACLGLVLGFQSSSKLAGAYGMAVSLTMLTTTALFYAVARRRWHWRPVPTLLVCGGFLGQPDVPALLEACAAHGLNTDPAQTTFFLSRETVLPRKERGLAPWRRRLFATLSRNAQSDAAFFQLRPNRVVELGMQVEV
jgi:K+ transporter